MRSLRGEILFGIGISIFAGAFVLLWQYIIENRIPKDIYAFYLGLLICAGIFLIYTGALRINHYENINKIKQASKEQNNNFCKYLLSKLWESEDKAIFGIFFLIISFIILNKSLNKLLSDWNSWYYLGIGFLLVLFGVKLLRKSEIW